MPHLASRALRAGFAVLLTAAAIFTACQEAKGAGVTATKAQNDFCSALYSIGPAKEKEYNAEAKKPGYIGQKDKLRAIEQKYAKAYNDVWDAHVAVAGWKGVLRGIGESEKYAHIGVEFFCDNARDRHGWMHFVTSSGEAGIMSQRLQEGMPIYEALKKFGS